MPQAESLRRCRRTRLHAVRLPAPLERRSHSRRCVKDALPYPFVAVAMGKQRVPTSARVPIFDARLLRELHAQAATVNVSLEGQRASAIVLARDQMSSAIKVGCSEFPSSRLLI